MLAVGSWPFVACSFGAGCALVVAAWCLLLAVRCCLFVARWCYVHVVCCWSLHSVI